MPSVLFIFVDQISNLRLQARCLHVYYFYLIFYSDIYINLFYGGGESLKGGKGMLKLLEKKFSFECTSITNPLKH